MSGVISYTTRVLSYRNQLPKMRILDVSILILLWVHPKTSKWSWIIITLQFGAKPNTSMWKALFNTIFFRVKKEHYADQAVIHENKSYGPITILVWINWFTQHRLYFYTRLHTHTHRQTEAEYLWVSSDVCRTGSRSVVRQLWRRVEGVLFITAAHLQRGCRWKVGQRRLVRMILFFTVHIETVQTGTVLNNNSP